MKHAALVAAILLLVGAAGFVKARVIYDCGAVGLLKGSEWIWAFGGCK